VEWVVPVLVAVIGGPLVVILQKLRDENTVQHAESRDLLKMVSNKVDKLDDKLDGHIHWHLSKSRRKTKEKSE
jgi:hypothetical protein